VTLTELTTGIPGLQLAAESNPTLTGLAYDSRQVKPGDLFFALPGARSNGFRAGFTTSRPAASRSRG